MYYSVVVGREVGLYLSWRLCSDSVRKFSGAIFLKFEKLEEATGHLNAHGICHSDMCVYTDDDRRVSLHEYCTAHQLTVPPETSYQLKSEFYLGHGLFVELRKGLV